MYTALQVGPILSLLLFDHYICSNWRYPRSTCIHILAIATGNSCNDMDYIRKENVGMTRICHIYNTLQIPKYLKTGNFVKFLSVKIRISRNYLSNKTKIIHQIHCICQNQMLKKWPYLILSFFLSRVLG